MGLFTKAKSFLLGNQEIDIIAGQIYNYVLKKKLVYMPELELFFKGLSNYEELKILEFLKKQEMSLGQ